MFRTTIYSTITPERRLSPWRFYFVHFSVFMSFFVCCLSFLKKKTVVHLGIMLSLFFDARACAFPCTKGGQYYLSRATLVSKAQKYSEEKFLNPDMDVDVKCSAWGRIKNLQSLKYVHTRKRAKQDYYGLTDVGRSTDNNVAMGATVLKVLHTRMSTPLSAASLLMQSANSPSPTRKYVANSLHPLRFW